MILKERDLHFNTVFCAVGVGMESKNRVFADQFVCKDDVDFHLAKRCNIVTFVINGSTCKGNLMAGGDDKYIFILFVRICLIVTAGRYQT